MKTLIQVAAGMLLLLSGCAPYKVTVYGGSGEAYTAPSLCAALLACQNSGKESSCHYEDDSTVTADGQIHQGVTCASVPAAH